VSNKRQAPPEEEGWFDVSDAISVGIPRPTKLRLLADAHFPREVVDEVRAAGLDIKSAQEMGVAKLADPELFRFARKIERVLLTLDGKFWRERDYSVHLGGGVIWLDTGPQEVDRTLHALGRAYSYVGKSMGNLIARGVRVRATPTTLMIRLRTYDGRIGGYEFRVGGQRLFARELEWVKGKLIPRRD